MWKDTVAVDLSFSLLEAGRKWYYKNNCVAGYGYMKGEVTT